MNINPFKQDREKFYKNFYLFQDFLKTAALIFKSIGNVLFVLASISYLGVLVFHFGFRISELYTDDFFKIYHYIFYVIFFSKYLQEILAYRKRRLIGWIYEGGLFLFSVFVLAASIYHQSNPTRVYSVSFELAMLIIASALLVISQVYKLMSMIDKIKIHPSLLFALSFLMIIFIGSGLLILPKSHVGDLTFLQSLFTSTSAVCVTGLIVVDTATAFTMLGKIIILVLIQIGGLGIMAFTGFFGFIFTGTVSFKDRLLLKDIMSSDSLGGVFRLITKIILLTLLIELIGAVIIYFNIGDAVADPLFFSIFHSVSAFCNAGFSILSNGLASPELQGNYVVTTTIASLIILGGIGFPVLIMLYTYLKHTGRNLFSGQGWKKMPADSLKQNIGVRIALITSILLLIIGTLFYLIFEKNHSLETLTGVDKFVAAFFGSVSARTAGFNVVDITRWTYPTIFLMIFLMWIGASPGSTGGGIKTTTFAMALHVVRNFVRGRHVVHVGYRRIGSETLIRVLVIIVLSIIVVFLAFIGLMLADPAKDPVKLLFETVSAYGTVGLSIINTSTLSHVGKVIIIFTMFIGRVGPLALLSGIFTIHKKRYYNYPVKDLIIN